MCEIAWKEGRGNRPIVGGKRAEPYRRAQLFVQRTPASCWERIGSIDDLDTSGLHVRARCRPDHWEHLVVAQGHAGWSDEQLQENWFAFSSYPIWHLFDVSDIAIAFRAVTALMLVARLGVMAWEQMQ